MLNNNSYNIFNNINILFTSYKSIINRSMAIINNSNKLVYAYIHLTNPIYEIKFE